MAEGRKVGAEDDDDDDEFGDEDDEIEVDEESLPFLSTAEIATWSFEGGLASPPRSFCASAEKRLFPSLPPSASPLLPSSRDEEEVALAKRGAIIFREGRRRGRCR